MLQAQGSPAPTRGASSETNSQRLARLFDTINLSARLFDDHLSDAALSERAKKLRELSAGMKPGAPAAAQPSPPIAAAAPAPLAPPPTAPALPPALTTRERLQRYVRKQEHAFCYGAKAGRSVQQTVIHPLFYWPLWGLTRALPDKVWPSLAAVRWGLTQTTTLAYEAGLHGPQWALALGRDVVLNHSLRPLLPLGWAILFARVFECYVGHGVCTDPPAHSSETGPTFFYLQNFERYGLVGLLTELPLLKLASQAERKNHGHIAAVLMGAACGTTFLLQGLRLGVVALIAINMGVCGGLAVGVATFFDVVEWVVRGLTKLLSKLTEHSQSAEQFIAKKQKLIHRGPRLLTREQRLAEDVDIDETHPHSVRAASENLGFAAENPHTTTITTRPLIIEEQQLRKVIPAHHLTLQMRGPSLRAAAADDQPMTPVFGRPTRGHSPLKPSCVSRELRELRRQQSLTTMDKQASRAALTQAPVVADSIHFFGEDRRRISPVATSVHRQSNLRGEGQRQRRERLPVAVDMGNMGAARSVARRYPGSAGLLKKEPQPQVHLLQAPPMKAQPAEQVPDSDTQSSHSSEEKPRATQRLLRLIGHTPLASDEEYDEYFGPDDVGTPANVEQPRDSQIRPRATFSVTAALNAAMPHNVSFF